MIYNLSLFIFRRDLRIIDNTALLEALRVSQKVMLCFIFDDRQIQNHPYQSKPALHFMLESLADLEKECQNAGGKLHFYQGLADKKIAELHEKYEFDAVFFNRDYTPFSRQRDFEIAQICEQLNLKCHIFADALLLEPEQAVKSDKQPYKVFTAFYNNARRFGVALPKTTLETRFFVAESDIELNQLNELDSFKTTSIQGGRTAALTQLEKLENCFDYSEKRDFPFLEKTSQLSAHLKFGTLSVREIFYAIIHQLGEEHPLLRQLYWRDFFTHISYFFPHTFGHAFIEKFDVIVWDNRLDYFQAWRDGKTGFPIVDAGMRELNQTGFMHNRVRMIVASFLTKDLRISWRWGERYFAQHLIDYDPCVNNGNWQWAASTGCDAQPYFRIFNPWLQQVKFDENGDYIYRWIPELRDIPVKIIHQWETRHFPCDYPAPIVNHKIESQITKDCFKQLAII